LHSNFDLAFKIERNKECLKNVQNGKNENVADCQFDWTCWCEMVKILNEETSADVFVQWLSWNL
jgi:hypothetical protein